MKYEGRRLEEGDEMNPDEDMSLADMFNSTDPDVEKIWEKMKKDDQENMELIRNLMV